jgi:hypothetical protein
MRNAIFVLANRNRMHPQYGWVGFSDAMKKKISAWAKRQPGYVSSEDCIGDVTLNPMFFFVDEVHACAAALILECGISGIKIDVQ